MVAWNFTTKNFVSNIEKENANAQMKIKKENKAQFKAIFVNAN